MTCFIHSQAARKITNKIKLIYATSVLDQGPVRRQRQTQQLDQKNAVETVVADKNNRFILMLYEQKTQCISGPGGNVLQRFTSRKSHEMRYLKPLGEKCGVFGVDFLVTTKLPYAVVDIDKFRSTCNAGAACLCYTFGGRHAALQRARINSVWPPAMRYIEQRRWPRLSRVRSEVRPRGRGIVPARFPLHNHGEREEF